MQPIRYSISTPNPATHLVHVCVEVPPISDVLHVALPCWTPGSYLMREFARQIEHFAAFDAEMNPLPCSKVTKDTWEIQTKGEAVTLKYELNAQELGVRQPYLDDEFGFFLGSNLFVFAKGAQHYPVEVSFDLPEGWLATTAKIDGFQGLEFACANYDLLADTAVLLGKFEIEHFTVLGKPHAFVASGTSRLDLPRFIEETSRVIEASAEIFGKDLPYERYLIILLLADTGRGGLEHLDSMALLYPRTAFRQEREHKDFMTLVAHEFFHVWNVKRIHTDRLSIPFDYTQETYTRDLWVAEGWTSYFQYLIALRAGVIDSKYFLSELTKNIQRYEGQPGRHVQTVEESSFDTWVKLYRQDAHSPNAMISYYLKGSLIAFLLDLEIRHRTQNEQSLDDIMRHLWEEFGREGVGYPEGSMQSQVEAVVGGDFGDWFNLHVHSTADFDWDKALKHVGMHLRRGVAKSKPLLLGVSFKKGTSKIHTVYRGSSAESAGLMTRDEIIGVEGLRVSGVSLSQMLKTYEAGDQITINLWREGVLQERKLTLEARRSEVIALEVSEEVSELEEASYEAWIRIPS